MQLFQTTQRCQEWVAAKWLTSYRLNAIRTAAYGMAHRRGAARLALILGCQRSGTTMLSSVLGLSPRVKNYGEGDAPYFRRAGAPRLLPLEQVEESLKCERNPLVLLKPLCESQRALEILHRFEGSKAIWIVRNYRDCVASHVKYYRQFHDGLGYVREMLALDAPCWKNEYLSEDVRELFATMSKRQLNLETGYALYWLARNSLVESIPTAAPVMFIDYDRVLVAPARSLKPVFAFLTIPFAAKYTSIVAPPPASRNGEAGFGIDQDVAERCEELLRRLQTRILSSCA